MIYFLMALDELRTWLRRDERGQSTLMIAVVVMVFLILLIVAGVITVR